ncbi:MAG: hypothetical protein ACI4KR_06400, partial [Ruminiclostridium sp.]
ERYKNAMEHSDKQNAKDESDRATFDAVLAAMNTNLEIYKRFMDDPHFADTLRNFIFNRTYRPNGTHNTSNSIQPNG